VNRVSGAERSVATSRLQDAQCVRGVELTLTSGRVGRVRRVRIQFIVARGLALQPLLL
jgi:hypothetical protein